MFRNLLSLSEFFCTDDGSLPEVELHFSDPTVRDVAINLLGSSSERGIPPGLFTERHAVLSDLKVDDMLLPPIGVFLNPAGLILDYRMGEEWQPAQINSFLILLRRLLKDGGMLAVPWWGSGADEQWQDLLTAHVKP